MEGEIHRFILVWALALVSLCYCHMVGKIIPKGIFRLLPILPVIFLFLLLPLYLSTIFLGGPTSFFLAWLANFKLLLFSFGQGPLSASPAHSLPLFLSLACLPIKIQDQQKHTRDVVHTSPLNYASKMLLLSTCAPVYHQKQNLHPHLLLFMYSVYLYIALEFTLFLFACFARTCLGLELEPQFKEPYLATSLQDFWGKRWNLMVTGILRPAVYNPVKAGCSRVIGSRWASAAAVLAVFLVSGMMHEIIFYYLGRKKPTWELTWFFLLHGLCVVVEVAVKKAVNGKWRLPRAVSGLSAVGFVVVTGLWLFMPQMLSCEADVKALREMRAFINFIQGVARWDKYARIPPIMIFSA